MLLTQLLGLYRTYNTELRAAVEEIWAKEQELRDQAGVVQRALTAQCQAEAAQMVC